MSSTDPTEVMTSINFAEQSGKHVAFEKNSSFPPCQGRVHPAVLVAMDRQQIIALADLDCGRGAPSSRRQHGMPAWVAVKRAR